jgi:hypothetical protein
MYSKFSKWEILMTMERIASKVPKKEDLKNCLERRK